MADPRPEPVWAPPGPGFWRSDFRLPEWLPAPVSRSFETWLLPRLDRGFAEAAEADLGLRLVLPSHAVVNGWCFARDPKAEGMAGAVIRHPLRMARMLRAFATFPTRPERFEADVAGPAHRCYLDDLLPDHRRVVADVAPRTEEASSPALVEAVDRLGLSSGTLMLPMVQALGFAGKAEFALARFHTDHLRPALDTGHLDLLAGLVDPTATSDHTVSSLDWIEPTGPAADPGDDDQDRRRDLLRERREAAERSCRQVLAGKPRLAARFDELLAVARRWVPVRESMAADFTLAWPALRAAMLRLGAQLRDHGVLDDPGDVFHLTRAEVVAAVGGATRPLAPLVARRRQERDARRTLSVPLSLGEATGPWRRMDTYWRVYRMEPEPRASVLVRGIPASPGSASGPVRVVRGPEDFADFRDGEVLVASVTAPGWTPLFAHAAAVVTDGGSPFAHASIVAREFAIPAVVGTGDATSRLVTGQTVVVDGRCGTVEPA